MTDGFPYAVDNVHLVSTGIDIGSATMNLTVAGIHLRRDATGLSSRYDVVDTTPRWRSAVVLTPYRDDETIDAGLVARFVADQYAAAGLTPAMVDTGAVILTGAALERRNARALADAVAASAGGFVCVSAGHHLEAALSAHGSGAVALSRTAGPLLCVDIGGGTTKLSLLRDGEIVATAAVAIGARMVTWAGDGTVTRVTPAAAALGAPPPGTPLTGEDALADAVLAPVRAVLAGDPGAVDPALWLTAPLDLGRADFAAVAFAGGVAEYVYGREQRAFGDLGRAMGRSLAARPGAPVVDPGTGIRATVVGASEHTVQVSGSTVAVPVDTVLPARDILVLHPRVALDGPVDADAVAGAVRDELVRFAPDATVVGLAFRFAGPPAYPRLLALAQGVAAATRGHPALRTLVVLVDADIAASLGGVLRADTDLGLPAICLDNVRLRPFDHVDIGTPVEPAGVFPVVIKSLLFGDARSRPRTELEPTA